VIPDGNRRWARRRRASVSQAYAIGFCKVIQVVLALSRRSIRELTFFGLSHDNYLKRPPDEVDSILTRIIDSMQVATHLLGSEGIRIRFFGALEELGRRHHDGLLQIESATALAAPATNLNILVNYSFGSELHRAGRPAAHEIPPCDCVFRSGGRRRLSGFLPLQSAEAELCFSRKLWPDVQPPDVERRIFGRIRKNAGA
jgi:undecaprenyl diphosphate synthase